MDRFSFRRSGGKSKKPTFFNMAASKESQQQAIPTIAADDADDEQDSTMSPYAPTTASTNHTEASPQTPETPVSASKSQSLNPKRLLKNLKRARSPTPGKVADSERTTTPASKSRHVPKKRSLGNAGTLLGISGQEATVDDQVEGAPAVREPDVPVAPSFRTAHHGRPKVVPSYSAKVPEFLTLSAQEQSARFAQVDELEQYRMILDRANNVDPNQGRWRRVKESKAMALDRYSNIWPYDGHRIKLNVPAGKLDYINASPIKVEPSKAMRKRAEAGQQDPGYIAMQGPKKDSVSRVWRMVSEQLGSTGVIVMLTEPYDAMMEKCYPYYPQKVGDAPIDVAKGDEFGDGFRASVHCEAIEETVLGDAVELRKLVMKVRRTKGSGRTSPSQRASSDSGSSQPAEDVDAEALQSPRKETANMLSGMNLSGKNVITARVSPAPSDTSDWEERTIWHFLYKKWPDFGVVETDNVEQLRTLMRLARGKNIEVTSPLLVHCSAGVGRSGTYIALEHLSAELEAGSLQDWDRDASGTQQVPVETSQMDTSEDGLPNTPGEPAVDQRAEEMIKTDLIFNVVNQLRMQRRQMVQMPQQYMFLYQVLVQLWAAKYAVSGGDAEQNSHSIVDGGVAMAASLTDPFVDDTSSGGV